MTKTSGKSKGRFSGRWLTTLEGYRAFYPNPLPPPLQGNPALVTALADAPFLTPRGAEEKLDLAYTTVMRAIGQLEKLKVLKEVSEAKRDRVYCAKAILDILEEPARLTPGETA